MKPEPLKRIFWQRTPHPNSRSELNRLSPEEDTRVRSALDVARIRFGNWKGLAAALKTNKRTITRLLRRERRITPAYAMRLARVLGVALGDILTGKFPQPGECPLCGHRKRVAAGVAVGTQETVKQTVARLRTVKTGTKERRIRARSADKGR
jgi:hypothetical protein